MSVQQPTWNLPTRTSEEPVLKVYNSLTRSKVGFDLIKSFDGFKRDIDGIYS